MSYPEEEYLMISGIQHFLFCQRQWALIHLEAQWAENRLTAEGDVVHRNAHKENFSEKRAGLLTVRGLRVSSPRLGMTGQCDVVEFQEAEEGAVIRGHRGFWEVVPVEYKRGKDKEDESDIAQLCCEAMCLEDMLGCEIPYGFLYYDEIRRRRKIELTEELRQRVRDTVEEMHACFRRGHTPHVKTSKKCQSCSIKEICLPVLCKKLSAAAYLKAALCEGDSGSEEETS